MQQEQWINEVLGSLSGLTKTKGNPFLHTRVLAKIGGAASLENKSSTIQFALASFVVLVLMLNVFLWNEVETTVQDTTTVSAPVNEYDLTAIDY